MPAERFDLRDRSFRFLRLPVAQVNQRGDRRGIGKGQHGGVITEDQALVHHTGKDVREYLRQPGQELLRRQLPCAVVPELLQRQHLAKHLQCRSQDSLFRVVRHKHLQQK